MSAPTKACTWQFSLNNCAYLAQLGDFGTLTRTVLLTVKNQLIGFSLSPWVVRGSSDAATAGMEGTDRWSVIAKLVWAANGSAHSWIVLRQAGLSNFEVCIDLNNAASTSYLGSVIVSTGGLFTGGSTTTRPTATDEYTLVNHSVLFNGEPGDASLYWYDVMQATDGSATRIIGISMQGGNPLGRMLAFFETVGNPVAGWTNPVAFTWSFNNAYLENTLAYSWSHDAARVVIRANSGAFGVCYLGAPGVNGVSSFGAIGEVLTVPHDFGNDEWSIDPMTLICSTIGMRGVWGTMRDMYWGNTYFNAFIGYEDGVTHYAWAQLGHVVFPWDGATMPRMR